jgi:hypothetical protein
MRLSAVALLRVIENVHMPTVYAQETYNGFEPYPCILKVIEKGASRLIAEAWRGLRRSSSCLGYLNHYHLAQGHMQAMCMGTCTITLRFMYCAQQTQSSLKPGHSASKRLMIGVAFLRIAYPGPYSGCLNE